MDWKVQAAEGVMSGEAQIREASLHPCTARHYTVAQVAERWQLSDDSVRKIFEREPGVLAIGEARSTGRKRRYLTLRIPVEVLERVHRRLQLQGGAR